MQDGGQVKLFTRSGHFSYMAVRRSINESPTPRGRRSIESTDLNGRASVNSVGSDSTDASRNVGGKDSRGKNL